MIIWVAFVATKLYHTSSFAVPAHPARDCVAATVVPAVGLHVFPTVSEVAVAHSLLDGGGGGGGNSVTQIPPIFPLTASLKAQNLT